MKPLILSDSLDRLTILFDHLTHALDHLGPTPPERSFYGTKCMLSTNTLARHSQTARFVRTEPQRARPYRSITLSPYHLRAPARRAAPNFLDRPTGRNPQSPIPNPQWPPPSHHAFGAPGTQP
jgi:hypothetical protein